MQLHDASQFCRFKYLVWGLTMASAADKALEELRMIQDYLRSQQTVLTSTEEHCHPQHRILASLLWSWVVGLGKKPTRHVCQVPLMMLFVKQCSHQAKGGQAKLSMTLVLSCRSRTWRAWEMKAFLLRWKSIPSCHGCWIYIYTCLRNQPLRQLFLLALQQDWCATVLWIAWRWCARSRGDWSSTLKESRSHRCTWSNIRQARLFCPAGFKHTSPMTSPPKSDWMRVTCRIFHQVLPFDVAQSFFGPRTSLH